MAERIRLDEDYEANPKADRSLKVAIPRPSRNIGVGSYQGQDRQMVDRPLLTESDFPQPSTKTLAYM